MAPKFVEIQKMNNEKINAALEMLFPELDPGASQFADAAIAALAAQRDTLRKSVEVIKHYELTLKILASSIIGMGERNHSPSEVMVMTELNGKRSKQIPLVEIAQDTLDALAKAGDTTEVYSLDKKRCH